MSYDYMMSLAELRDNPEESKQILEKAVKIISESIKEDLKVYEFKDISEYNSTAIALLKNPYYNFHLAGLFGENGIDQIWLLKAIKDSAQKYMNPGESILSQLPCNDYEETNEIVKKIIDLHNLDIAYSYQ